MGLGEDKGRDEVEEDKRNNLLNQSTFHFKRIRGALIPNSEHLLDVVLFVGPRARMGSLPGGVGVQTMRTLSPAHLLPVPKLSPPASGGSPSPSQDDAPLLIGVG